MSILCDVSSVLLDVASLLLPRTCLACGRVLLESEETLCLACRYNMPMTDFIKRKDNPMRSLFGNMLPIESAAALFWFVGGTDWQRVIHSFKYRGRWYFARKLGEWLGEELRDSGNFEGVDVIIPIPLHFRRRLVRGYNQSEYLALGVASKLDVECDFRTVRRKVYNESQTLKSRKERWDNVEEIFEVRKADRLRGRHILLIDDVMTTGATISSCAESIFRACEGDVRISIATLAVSRRVVGEM